MLPTLLLVAADMLPPAPIHFGWNGEFRVPIVLRGDRSAIRAVEVWGYHPEIGWKRCSVVKPTAEFAELIAVPQHDYVYGFHIEYKDGTVKPPYSERPSGLRMAKFKPPGYNLSFSWSFTPGGR